MGSFVRGFLGEGSDVFGFGCFAVLLWIERMALSFGCSGVYGSVIIYNPGATVRSAASSQCACVLAGLRYRES